jgi:TrmH family RNA methyltransferase
MGMTRVTSARHPAVVFAKALATAHGRRKHGLMLLEGAKAVADALANGVTAHSVIMTEGAPRPKGLGAGVPVCEVPAKLFSAISQVPSPQGVMLLAEPPFAKPAEVLALDFVLVADGVQDPGNLGTLLRTARAFGVGGVAATEGTADPSSPRALRAAAGTWPGLPFVPGVPAGELAVALGNAGFRVLVGEAGAERGFREDVWRGKVALVVGSEGRGPSAEFARAGALAVGIPLSRGVESLNVAAAAAVLLAEAARARTAPVSLAEAARARTAPVSLAEAARARTAPVSLAETARARATVVPPAGAARRRA